MSESAKRLLVRDLDPAALSGGDDPAPASPKAIAGKVLTEIVQSKGGFEEFRNDLPWQDDAAA